MRNLTAPKSSYREDLLRKNSSYQNQKQQLQKFKHHDRQKQKVIHDQNYSNNIMMIVFSTLQSLQSASRNIKSKRQNKLYGHYDKINFDDKNYSELRSQLQTQLTLLKASRHVFSEENPKDKYELPTSFNQNKVKLEINRFKSVFRNDPDIHCMCVDFENIISGNFNSKMNFQTKNYSVKYSADDTIKNRRDVLKRGMMASSFMDRQKEKIEQLGIKDQRDLPIYLNHLSHSHIINDYYPYYPYRYSRF